jgi:nucleoside-diphosphate-sugar epimerase
LTHETLSVAVTGGAGFIGRHFCGRLRSESALESILDIRTPRDRGPSNRHVVGDVRDPAAVREALRGANAVLHLAAAHHDFGIDRETFFSVNEGAARTLCDVMDEFRIRKLCFFSSVAVYGSSPESTDEAAQCRPDSWYGESKLAGERVFRAWTEQGAGRTALVIRPTVTFGSGHFANMYTLVRQIASRAYVPVGPGANLKSLVYVDNLVDATLDLWARTDMGAFEVYNVVDKPDLSSRAIADTVYRALDRSPPRVGIPLWAALLAAKPFDLVIAVTRLNLPISSARVRKFADANTVFAADKLANAGIRPEVPLKTGIQRMVEWYQREGHALPIERSIPPREVVRLANADVH